MSLQILRWSSVLVLLAGLVPLSAGCADSSGGTTKLPEDAAAPGDALCSALPGEPGEACACDGTCAAGAQCTRTFKRAVPLAVCTSLAAGTCSCGAFINDECVGGAGCLCPSGGEDMGICLTVDQKAVFCAGPLAASYLRCSSTGWDK